MVIFHSYVNVYQRVSGLVYLVIPQVVGCTSGIGPVGDHLTCLKRDVPQKAGDVPASSEFSGSLTMKKDVFVRLFHEPLVIIHWVRSAYCGWLRNPINHQKDGSTPINNGINHLSTGAGFLPSTVCLLKKGVKLWSEATPSPWWTQSMKLTGRLRSWPTVAPCGRRPPPRSSNRRLENGAFCRP